MRMHAHKQSKCSHITCTVCHNQSQFKMHSYVAAGSRTHPPPHVLLSVSHITYEDLCRDNQTNSLQLMCVQMLRIWSGWLFVRGNSAPGLCGCGDDWGRLSDTNKPEMPLVSMRGEEGEEVSGTFLWVNSHGHPVRHTVWMRWHQSVGVFVSVCARDNHSCRSSV